MIRVICPTRRPTHFRSLVSSFRATSTLAELWAYVDDDMVGQYETSDRVTLVTGPRLSLTASCNRLAEGADIVGIVPDDAEFHVRDWDLWLLQQFPPDGILLVSPAHNGGSFVSFPFVTHNWIERTGWYACPDMERFAWDTAAELLGEATRILHAPAEDFYVHHHHLPAIGLDRLEPDALAFLRWVAGPRKALVRSLREVMR